MFFSSFTQEKFHILYLVLNFVFNLHFIFSIYTLEMTFLVYMLPKQAQKLLFFNA